MSLEAGGLIRQAGGLNRSGLLHIEISGNLDKLYGGKLLSLFTTEGPRNFTQLQFKFLSIQTISRLKVIWWSWLDGRNARNISTSRNFRFWVRLFSKLCGQLT